MNVIDQAFVKAYSRRTKPQAAEPTSEPAAPFANTAAGTSDVSVHPRAAKSAVLWVDAVADQYLRPDAPHREASTSSAGETTDREQADLSLLCHTQVAAAPTQPSVATAPCDPLLAAPAAIAPRDTAPTPVTTPEPAPPPTAECEPFTAAWEVDALKFSNTITALFDTPGLSRSIGYPLDRTVNEGLQTLLITSERTGVGQTSVATGIAISAAAAGLRVALVDAASAAADDSAGSLADALNLDVSHGWLEAIRGGKSVAETSIHSIEDQLTVIPQILTAADHGPTADEFGRLIQLLRPGFDLIVIDGPCCQEPAFEQVTCPPRTVADSHLSDSTLPAPSPVDAVILVQDARDADSILAKRIMQSLKHHGITGLGLVENFVENSSPNP